MISVTSDVGYETKSGNRMCMRIHGIPLDRQRIPLIDDGLRYNYCQTGKRGCKGQSGACPPYAPYFDILKPSCSSLYVVVLEFDTAWSILYSGWRAKNVNSSVIAFIAWHYADAITACYMRRIGKSLSDYGMLLSLASCRGCNKKHCTVMQGGKCRNPRKRTYSLEATGVHCGILHEELFDEVMPWWFHTYAQIPVHMYRYIGILCNTNLKDEVLEVVRGDWSYIDIENVPTKPDYEIDVLNIPDDYFMMPDVREDLLPAQYPVYNMPEEEKDGNSH